MTRYTLDEAAKIQVMNSCARNDHSWNIVQMWNSKGPLKIICDDCGWSGSVAMGEYPKRPEGVTTGFTTERDGRIGDVQ